MLTCHADILESGRTDNNGLNLLITHPVYIIVKMNEMYILDVDKQRLLMGPWTNELTLKLGGETLRAVQLLQK